jgi:hypothetical protein
MVAATHLGEALEHDRLAALIPCPILGRRHCTDSRRGSSRTASARTSGRARVVRLIRAITVAGTAIGAVEAGAGIAYGEPRAIAIGLTAVAYAGWLFWASRRLETASRETIVTRIALVTLGIIAAAAVLEPTIASAMAIAALLPGVLVLPFLNSRGVGRILAVTAVVGLGSVAAGQLLAPSERLPSEVTGVLAMSGCREAVAPGLERHWEW